MRYRVVRNETTSQCEGMWSVVPLKDVLVNSYLRPSYQAKALDFKRFVMGYFRVKSNGESNRETIEKPIGELLVLVPTEIGTRTMRLRSGSTGYFALIDPHFELGRPNFAGPRKKRPECVCAKTARATCAHTHLLN